MKILAPAICFVVLASCAPNKSKAPESTGDRTSLDAPVPNQAMAKKYGFKLEKIGLGHAVYMRKCGECHLHVLPDEINSRSWHVIVPGMSWNAGLSPEEEDALHDYLQAASKEQTGKKS